MPAHTPMHTAHGSCLAASKLLRIMLVASSLHHSTVVAFSPVARSASTTTSSSDTTTASSLTSLLAGSFYDSPQTANSNNINSSNNSNNPPVTKPPLKKKDLRTLARFLEVECWKSPGIRNLDRALLAVSDACKQINRIVQRAQTDDLYGAAVDPLTGQQVDENIQGEVQQQLDVLCNTLMLRAFCGGSNNAICAVASEEEPLPRSCADVMGYDTVNFLAEGEYVAVFDPIDGSKNIDASLPVGTVFGIYKSPEGIRRGEDGWSLDSFLQRGTKMVAAGYCLYSATTVLVLTLGSGVHGFTLDPDKQTFLQTHPNMRIPDVGSLYSFNEANSREFSEPVQQFLEKMKESGKIGGKKITSRYVGALVADVHNILINGGIYGYPSTRDNPKGKLRLLYESAPMAMIIEQAGGAGSTGRGRILDVLPSAIHERVPTFLGSVENVFELEQFHKYYGEEDEH